MTADYNGWNDAPEAEREAMDVYSRQEFEEEALAQGEDLQFKEVYSLTPAARAAAAVGVPRGERDGRRPVPAHILEDFPADTDHQRQVLQKVC